jgi:hypothetical protein
VAHLLLTLARMSHTSSSESQRDATQTLALLFAAVSGLLIVIATPMAVVPIVGCLGLPLFLLAFLGFALSWLVLGDADVALARKLIGAALVIVALFLFFRAYASGVGIIVEHFQRREGAPSLSEMWRPFLSLVWSSIALASGIAVRHKKPIPLAPRSTLLYALTAVIGWSFLAILCALGLPTTA